MLSIATAVNPDSRASRQLSIPPVDHRWVVSTFSCLPTIDRLLIHLNPPACLDPPQLAPPPALSNPALLTGEQDQDADGMGTGMGEVTAGRGSQVLARLNLAYPSSAARLPLWFPPSLSQPLWLSLNCVPVTGRTCRQSEGVAAGKHMACLLAGEANRHMLDRKLSTAWEEQQVSASANE